tara:strand:- start:1065 stop:1199 length:135 start_codon:yes stop_codon:yes gene_type:complete
LAKSREATRTDPGGIGGGMGGSGGGGGGGDGGGGGIGARRTSFE